MNRRSVMMERPGTCVRSQHDRSDSPSKTFNAHHGMCYHDNSRACRAFAPPAVATYGALRPVAGKQPPWRANLNTRASVCPASMVACMGGAVLTLSVRGRPMLAMCML
jgi:hypothetical protein